MEPGCGVDYSVVLNVDIINDQMSPQPLDPSLNMALGTEINIHHKTLIKYSLSLSLTHTYTHPLLNPHIHKHTHT